MRKRLLRLALAFLIIGALALLLTYFCFHYVTDEGISLTWHAEAGKPFVTLFIGVFGVMMISGSVGSLLCAFLLCESGEINDREGDKNEGT